MKICGFRFFRTYKPGFSRKYLLKCIGTAVIMLHPALLNEAKSRYYRSRVSYQYPDP